MEDVEFSTRIARLGPVYYEPNARIFILSLNAN